MGRNHKLAMRYFRPLKLKVIQGLGPIAYKLLSPQEARIHLVFHASLLKRWHGAHTNPQIPVPFLTNEKGPVLQPTQQLQYRQLKRIIGWPPQVLVKWQSLSYDDISWKDYLPLYQYYQNLDLGDKVSLHGLGNVIFLYMMMEKIKTVYQSIEQYEGKTRVREEAGD